MRNYRWAKSFNFNNNILFKFMNFYDKFISRSFIQWQVIVLDYVNFSWYLIVHLNQVAKGRRTCRTDFFPIAIEMTSKRAKVKSEGRVTAKCLSRIICSDYMYSVELHTVILYHVGYLTRFAMKANHFGENGSMYRTQTHYSDSLLMNTYIKYIIDSLK